MQHAIMFQAIPILLSIPLMSWMSIVNSFQLPMGISHYHPSASSSFLSFHRNRAFSSRHNHQRRISSNNPALLPLPSLHSTNDDLSSSGSEYDDESEEDEEDWRLFRARLISNPNRNDNNKSDDTSWAYDAGKHVEVGTLLLSTPTRDVCQGLHQQYFHRCVVLITECVEKGSGSGSGSGGGNTRGVILNRPTDWMIKGWNARFGGDIDGFSTDDIIASDDMVIEKENVICLHSLTCQKSREVSRPILPGLSLTSFADACALVSSNHATMEDFWVFAGHCEWENGQLEMEMEAERNEWYAASLDGSSILAELHKQQTINMQIIADSNKVDSEKWYDNTGSPMWDRLTSRIGHESDEATSPITKGQLRFFDAMLNAWTRNQLAKHHASTSSPISASASIKAGTLVRSSLPTSTSTLPPPFLLDEQEFHRSLILVLKDDDTSTVGVMLNLPLNGILEVTEDVILPLRYGGPIEIVDEESQEDEMDDQDGWTWLHCSSILKQSNIGSPLGDDDTESAIWIMTEQEAVDALLSNKIKPNEILLITGVCVWEKGDELGEVGGGLNEQVDVLGTFEVVMDSMSSFDSRNNDNVDNEEEGKRSWWDILTQQSVLSKETLEGNVEAAIAAWKLAGRGKENTVDEYRRDVVLGDVALRAWVAAYLLGDLSMQIELDD